MTDQMNSFLQISPSYNFFSTNKDNSSINPAGFQKWSQEYMYRSSYSQSHCRVAVR